MSKDIKKALEHCIDNECIGCPNNEELGSGDIVCRARLLPEVLEYVADLEAKLAESEKKIEELKGERLKFYTDDVRRTQVINGVHFDIEQLLVFSEYVEHEKNISADKEKKINQLNQQLHSQPAEIVEKIRNICSIEDKCKDGSFVLGINEKDLDNLLKEYQK